MSISKVWRAELTFNFVAITVKRDNFVDGISLRLNMFMMKSLVCPMSCLEGALSKLKFESNVCRFP